MMVKDLIFALEKEDPYAMVYVRDYYDPQNWIPEIEYHHEPKISVEDGAVIIDPGDTMRAFDYKVAYPIR